MASPRAAPICRCTLVQSGAIWDHLAQTARQMARQTVRRVCRPTIEAEVRLAGGAVGRAIAPAGASRGMFEAIDLRDGGEDFGGYGVEDALENVNTTIARLIEGMDARDQEAVDLAIIDLARTVTSPPGSQPLTDDLTRPAIVIGSHRMRILCVPFSSSHLRGCVLSAPRASTCLTHSHITTTHAQNGRSEGIRYLGTGEGDAKAA